MANVLSKATIQVGSKRRITLPDIVPFAVHDDILVERLDNDTVILSVMKKKENITDNGDDKVQIYGYIIGQHPRERVWIIFVDHNGLPVARKSCSTFELAFIDISRPDTTVREKFNNKCGVSNWKMPIFVTRISTFTSTCPDMEIQPPIAVIKKLQEISQAFNAKNWPPSNN